MAGKRGCTQCGECLLTCPVYQKTRQEEYSPKAKQDLIQLGEAGERDLDWEKVVELAGYCVSCERCLTACARKLSAPEALSGARAKNPRWQQYFWKEWVKRGDVLWSVAKTMSPLAPNRLLPEKLRIMHAAALAMTPPPEPEPWFRLAPDTPRTVENVPVVFFAGCTAKRLRPSWVRKTRETLRLLGARLLEEDGFVCCGGTYDHAGMRKSAHEAAEANLQRWRSLGRPKVVTVCASCIHSLRHYASMDGVMNETEAREWLAALTPLSSLLQGAKVELTGNAPAKYGYHSPCHWSGKDTDMAWLRGVLPGLAKGSALCCGFGGVFKMFHPTLSRDMAESCWDGLRAAADGTAILTGCSGCSMQLNAHAPKGFHALHWLDVWLP